jgi:hypothetical protein
MSLRSNTSLRNKLIGAAATTVLAGTVAFMPATIAQAAPAPTKPAAHKVASTTQPVTGTLADGTEFSGTISNLHSKVVDGVLTLTGTITGTGIPAGGTPFTSQVQNVDQLAVDDACNVLTLNLGPLHLDLLGLVVDLDQVNLNITAVPGAGNLLGNLLCAVAGLLDNNGPVQGISALLNRILAGLGLGL